MICKKFLKQNDQEMNYIVYAPEDTRDLPLVIYLHGAGERGENIDNVLRHGLARLLDEGKEFPAVILCPQCPRQFIWDNVVADLKKVIDKIITEYNIKPDRVSLTGSSMGGYGTWEMGMTYPEMFAAIAPVAGGGVTWRTTRLKNIPIRAYHGGADTCVEPIQSELMVKAVTKNGGSAELIVLDGFEHNDGIDEAYRNTDLVEWLLSHRKTDFSRVPEFCEEYF